MGIHNRGLGTGKAGLRACMLIWSSCMRAVCARNWPAIESAGGKSFDPESMEVRDKRAAAADSSVVCASVSRSMLTS